MTSKKRSTLKKSNSIQRFLTYQNDFEDAFKSIKTEDFLQKYDRAKQLMINTLRSKKMIAIAGNGGSNADSMHFSAELVNQFKYPHRPFPVLALGVNQPVITSWSNDQSFDDQFTREMLAYKDFLGLLICITTSGKSRNILKLISSAKGIGIPVIALTSTKGRRKMTGCDEILAVDSIITSHIQEVHTVIYHALSLEVELEFKAEP
jgi:D-inositol-3-phosphate glycosyltransferase